MESVRDRMRELHSDIRAIYWDTDEISENAKIVLASMMGTSEALAGVVDALNARIEALEAPAPRPIDYHTARLVGELLAEGKVSPKPREVTA